MFKNHFKCSRSYLKLFFKMTDNKKNDSFENENAEETSPKTALSTSFTISFEDEDQSTFKQKKIIKTTNMFVRRHVRTLSLPLGNICAPKQADCKSSADSREKMSKSVSQNDARTNGRKDVKAMKKHSPIESDQLESTESEDCLKSNGNCEAEVASDTESEGGTYTLDKDNKELIIARKTIDQVFGISAVEESIPSISNIATKSDEKSRSRRIDEWIEQSATAMKNNFPKAAIVTANSCLKNKVHISKIPSPVFGRKEFNVKVDPPVLNKMTENCRSKGTELRTLEQPVNSPTNGDIDTKSYLRETENIVAALHNRLKSDVKQCSETEKETSVGKYSNTKFNRAFSLRRDRLKKPAVPVINNTAIPVRKNSIEKYVSSNGRLSNANGHTPEKKTNTPRQTKPSSAPVCKTREQMRADELKKKTYPRSKGSGSRSNSSLSVQEIEFQNWKRRKSYDPLKAAAEDRKKKSMMQSAAGSASMSTAALTKKQKPADQNENDETAEIGITRSASFHGLRNKNGYEKFMFSGARDINRSVSNRFISSDHCAASEIVNVDEDEWVIPKPPSTSLQNTPPESVSSRLSLASHAMSSSSVILSSSSNTKVNFMTLLNVTQLTREIRSAVSCMTSSLKCSAENSGEYSVSQKQNGYSLDLKTDCSENIDHDNEDNTFYMENDFDLDEDYTPDTGDDDSRSNDLSGDYQLKIALNNLKEIQHAIQKFQLLCENK